MSCLGSTRLILPLKFLEPISFSSLLLSFSFRFPFPLAGFLQLLPLQPHPPHPLPPPQCTPGAGTGTSRSRVRLFATPWTVADQAPVHGIFQARVLGWVATSFSRGSSRPRDRTRVSRIVDRPEQTANPPMSKQYLEKVPFVKSGYYQIH